MSRDPQLEEIISELQVATGVGVKAVDLANTANGVDDGSKIVDGAAELALRKIEAYIDTQVAQAGLDELDLIKQAQEGEDWSNFCMDDSSDFSNYINKRKLELKAKGDRNEYQKYNNAV